MKSYKNLEERSWQLKESVLLKNYVLKGQSQLTKCMKGHNSYHDELCAERTVEAHKVCKGP